MPTIGLDCEIMLDGSGYYVKPGTWEMEYPRVRSGRTRADATEAYCDFGPGKRIWQFMVLALNDLVNYDGSPSTSNGQHIRDGLKASYEKVDTLLTLTDAAGTSYNVHFDSYIEYVVDLKTQQAGPAGGSGLAVSYEIAVTLVEG